MKEKEKLTAEEWLERKKWKNFLMNIPLNKAKGYLFNNSNDLAVIRVRATQLNKDNSCERKFSVTIDFDTKVATITANLKDND